MLSQPPPACPAPRFAAFLRIIIQMRAVLAQALHIISFRSGPRLRAALAILLLFFSQDTPSSAYSLLTHEQIIDLAWTDSIRPLLLERFPRATPAQLREAHAYAYGGCAIQDMGYYPFGHQFFSNLTHYVRTGAFISHLLQDAQTPGEYAFALGALSHYVGDSIGHQDAINLSTPIEFPHLAEEYGRSVTYDEAPHAHIRTEFAFDIDQLSRRRFAPAAYLRHVGIKVPQGLLDRAFAETYGLSLPSVLGKDRPAFRSYRTSVRSFIPRFAHAETVLHGGQFPTDPPSPELNTFLNRLRQADFQNGWGQFRKSPGFATYLLAGLIWIVPKVGDISDLAIRGPDQQTQFLFIRSVNRTVDAYASLLARFREERDGDPDLPDRDLDTGRVEAPGAYALTDETYAVLLHRIAAHPAAGVNASLREDILRYYSDPDAPIVTKKDPKAWARVQKDLATLRTMQPLPR
jgi:hypothetical protein